jgi:hypothetical protein
MNHVLFFQIQRNKRNLWGILLDHFKPLKTTDVGYCHDYHWGWQESEPGYQVVTWPVPNFDP